MEQSIYAFCFIDSFYVDFWIWICQRCLIMQLGFLHYSLIRGPFFFQSKGSNQLLVFKTLFIRSGYFSFLILHTHFSSLQISCIPSLGHCKTYTKWLMTYPLDLMDVSFSLIRSQLIQDLDLSNRLRSNL